MKGQQSGGSRRFRQGLETGASAKVWTTPSAAPDGHHTALNRPTGTARTTPSPKTGHATAHHSPEAPTQETPIGGPHPGRAAPIPHSESHRHRPRGGRAHKKAGGSREAPGGAVFGDANVRVISSAFLLLPNMLAGDF